MVGGGLAGLHARRGNQVEFNNGTGYGPGQLGSRFGLNSSRYCK